MWAPELFSAEKKRLSAPTAFVSNTWRRQGVCHKHSVSAFVYRSVAITNKAMGRWVNHRRHNIQPHRTNHTGAQQSISLAIGRYTKEFFEDTTIQGLRYIVAANTHPLET